MYYMHMDVMLCYLIMLLFHQNSSVVVVECPFFPVVNLHLKYLVYLCHHLAIIRT